MAKKPEFASKIGLIAATVGSAVGLGNIWRFPAETQANGGAAFLLIYILCVFLLGVPVMSAEFSLGRAGRSDAIGAFKNTGGSKKWWAVGGLAILASYFILWFYMVVAGWTLEYLFQSIGGSLYDFTAGMTEGEHFSRKMGEFISSGWNPLINTFLAIGINLAILIVGVQKGIERLSNILMPLLFLILLIFCFVSLSLPGASEGLAFFLNPDFSKITPTVALNALGQAFFSLSLGMGILITYSSYFPKETKLAKTAVTVSLLDLSVAFLMGLIIFPAVMSFHLEGEKLEGATLIFVTLPEIFSKMSFTRLWSSLFFLLLSVAAITSTISIAEVTVAFLQDRFRMSRIKACLATLLPLFLFSTICSLSQGPLSSITIFGKNIFDALDSLTTNILLPLGALLLCIYLGWFAPKALLKHELSNNGTIHSKFHNVIYFIIKYIAPVLIALVFISGLIR
ncbi:MAG: sodium-dependent transporter [Paramuribaculum sp.]|nr:sodium-dependent transporter [Paramuribaculum sp.]